MSREIKFRTWDGNQFRHLSVLPDKLMLPPIEPAASYVWEQYTGLKDRHGVEIYEGDILRLFDPRPQVEHKDKVSAVTFDNGAFLVDTQMGGLPDRTTLETLYSHLKWREFSECEVIGNIYQSQELLEAEK